MKLEWMVKLNGIKYEYFNLNLMKLSLLYITV